MAETDQFHHYQVLRRPDGALWELGRGAMGVTYKAYDTNLRCPVALKVINATYLHSETARARFLREARAAAGLSHPNVAAAFHLGQDSECYFYAMEFVDGETLDSLVRRQGALPATLALRITLQVARALRAAHRIGLVHRDIKPANLMVVREAERPAEAVLASAVAAVGSGRDGNRGNDDEDEEDIHVKVIDFGLAKTLRREGEDEGSASSAASLTMGGFVGTPHYASPEQLEEKEIDTRSDIYSLGATLWFALSGKPPFSGSLAQIMSQHLSRPPAFETLRAAGVPAPVIVLLNRMLAKDPANRPQAPSDLRRELEAALRAVQAGLAAPAAAAGGGTGDDGAATMVEGDSATPTSGSTAAAAPATGGGDISTGGGGSRSLPLAPGTMLANRYRLLREIGPEGRRGQLFQALDMDTQGPVAIKVLPIPVVADGSLFTKLLAEVERARQPGVAHPGLLTVHGLETLTDRPETLFIMEWAESFRLLEVLRHRRQLVPKEVFNLLEGLAAGVDHAAAHGLSYPDLGLGEVLLALENSAAPPPEATSARVALLSSMLEAWPAFRPKVLPLTLPEPSAASLGEANWTEARTMVGRPVDAEAVVPGYRRLAQLAVELLGGAGPGETGVGPGNAGRYTPFAALSERGNAVLRAALAAPGTANGGGRALYASAGEFVRALREAAGSDANLAPTVLPSSRSVAAPAAPPPPPLAPAPPPLPVFTPTPPPPPSSSAPASVARPARAGMSGVLVAAIVLGTVMLLGAAAGAVVYYGWQTVSTLIGKKDVNPTGTPDDPRRLRPTPTPPNAATPAPTAGLVIVPTAIPVVVTPTPTPAPAPTSTPTPAPTPSSEASFLAAAAEAARLDRAGDYTGAIEAWLGIARTYPARDPERTGLDGIVNNLRADLPPETEAGMRRARQLRPLLERAAAVGSNSASLLLGDSLAEPDPQTAATWYRQAAERGDTRAMIGLGNLYFRGRGVPADPSEAARWYEKASERGDAVAKVYLGECYQEGYGGVKRDPKRAFELYNEALRIEPNNARALDKLGYCYANGQGTVPDGRKAFDFTRRAADLGNLNALNNLGTFYMQGTGLPKPDAARGADLFRTGAEKDHPPCMYNYARCLEGGVGLKSNLNEARRWYRASAERGYPPAVDWCRKAGVSFTPKGA